MPKISVSGAYLCLSQLGAQHGVPISAVIRRRTMLDKAPPSEDARPFVPWAPRNEETMPTPG